MTEVPQRLLLEVGLIHGPAASLSKLQATMQAPADKARECKGPAVALA